MLDPEGGTPIGQAMVTAKLALDATGLSRRHLLVVSDGENTDGFRPEDVLVHMLPLFHVHGLFVACHCVLMNGTSMRFHPRFDAKRAIDDFEHARFDEAVRGNDDPVDAVVFDEQIDNVGDVAA